MLFVLSEALTLVLGPFFVLSLWGFSLLCRLVTVILDSPFSYSNYLTFPPQEMRGPILWKYGCRGLSGYFLLNWDDEGRWVSPLASLNPQSPHSGVQLRVSDISVVSCSFIHLC